VKLQFLKAQMATEARFYAVSAGVKRPALTTVLTEYRYIWYPHQDNFNVPACGQGGRSNKPLFDFSAALKKQVGRKNTDLKYK